MCLSEELKPDHWRINPAYLSVLHTMQISQDRLKTIAAAGRNVITFHNIARICQESLTSHQRSQCPGEVIKTELLVGFAWPTIRSEPRSSHSRRLSRNSYLAGCFRHW
jgi:hypothetical protein